MHILVATDIHGTDDTLRRQLALLGSPVSIVSPWPGDGRPFATEQQAVQAFHRDDGLAAFERSIAAAAGDAPCFYIGFSVGAAALWRHVAGTRCHPGSRAFLYYGSRIRDARHLLPRCPTTLYFAAHEPSFEPAVLARELAASGADCHVLDGTHHGFMNAASPHFRPDIADAHLSMLRRCMDSQRQALASGPGAGSPR
ncbi:hydrolase [Rubrivivax gelatinosus]|nr:hydrolase [Rubrivivax gelatinosus]